jgi:hypothetical protein
MLSSIAIIVRCYCLRQNLQIANKLPSKQPEATPMRSCKGPWMNADRKIFYCSCQGVKPVSKVKPIKQKVHLVSDPMMVEAVLMAVIEDRGGRGVSPLQWTPISQ